MTSARTRPKLQATSLLDLLDDASPADTPSAPLFPATPIDPPSRPPDDAPLSVEPTAAVPISSPGSRGEKGKARDLLAAVRLVNQLDAEQRPATPAERVVLEKFGGFGAVALSLFPNPLTGDYKDAGWKELGEELQSLLSRDDYASAKRTTFTAFYTAPLVIDAMFAALDRLGVPTDGTILEPGCGSGHFLSRAAPGRHFVGVELDRTSGRIAKALHADHDIRVENFRDTRLAPDSLDAVVGNVPFADLKLDHNGRRFSLHDYFFAKSVDALKPGGVLALVTSHYTLDKQNASLREYLDERADFLGAIRLPSDAFKQEGTQVVTDIVFLRKREEGEPARPVDPDWLHVAPHAIEGVPVPINHYFHTHPEMVLGTYSRQDTLYGGETNFRVNGRGHLAEDLRAAVGRLPQFEVQREPQPRPPPPPPPPGPDQAMTLGEGSFFVGPDRTIRQVRNGQGEPVVYGGVTLRADGTMTGRRLASLIGLRDQARRVLQSQNEGWDESQRVAARRALNASYDRFVTAYGPINKTTQSATAEGSVVRRMPNVVKFRDDPDAMLVLALEQYDDETGTAAPAAILRQDVVGPKRERVNVRSAEEGLLVSLDRRGVVDLPFIAALYGRSEAEVLAELGQLVYLDPTSKSWQTADEYLSGNVRAKLAEAERAGPAFARNVEALRPVQPPDVLPGEIDANLGAPWIPSADIEAFAADLFRVAPGAVQLGHLKKDAVWTVDASAEAERSVAATSEFGTPRASGVTLLELALNLKTPAIYDVIRRADREERVLNAEATLAAGEKQRAIKEKFRQWVFADPDRTERLVRVYNDTYNAVRLRTFDGSHLDFPGLNRTLHLRPHQQDAVWRGMSGGNTLLAHCVGAGKTFTMAATGMKLRQAGLVRKPMYVVPNHMLEQFAREFLHLYPNAKLLVAGKDDLTRDRRKLLTAKIASGDWDGVIVTHSSFERIGLSADYQARFLRDQIGEYEQLLTETARRDLGRGRRNLIKVIEKQKARREERLKDLLAAEKKDDGLVFDELGVDGLFVDEAHAFKNLETPTKMERVAGVQTGGSERAFDLLMKCRYLDERHPGRGVVFATGTPVSNTMVELYTLQRYLDPRGLASRGLEHFDAWAATFGEVVEAMEIAPDGASLRPRSRFAKFVNLPELQQLFRSVADVQTAEQLDLPRPHLRGGKPETVACPMSEAQAAVQRELVARYERIRRGGVDPREDNALAITTDGRKLALDARLVSAEAEDHPDSKLNALVANVARIWRESTPVRGTQLVFCDLGVNPTPWGFSVYDEIDRKLIEAGIPAEQIAVIGEADSDEKKQALFERVRAGRVRVLLGSTQKMGVGTNVQKRLVALHHLDAPWKPAEVEQREGRILRQGNDNAEVAIYRYVTEASFDAYMWQALETKARFISQVIRGESTVRRAEDVGGQELSYAEVKAIASGNPAVLVLAEADAELQRLTVLRKSHADDQYLARRNLRELPRTVEFLRKQMADFAADGATVAAHPATAVTLGNRSLAPDDALKVLAARLNSLPVNVSAARTLPLGMYRGLRFGLVLHPLGPPDVYLEGASRRQEGLSREHQGPKAVLNTAERIAGSYDSHGIPLRRDLALAETQLRDYQARLGLPFVHEAYLDELTRLRDQLRIALSTTAPAEGAEGEPSGPSAAELAASIYELKERHARVTMADVSPVRPTAPAASPRRRPVASAAAASPPLVEDSTLPSATDGTESPETPDPTLVRNLEIQANRQEPAVAGHPVGAQSLPRRAKQLRIF